MKDMQTGTNTNSMNNKPIGTTTGESSSGSVDETKEGLLTARILVLTNDVG